MDNFAEILGAYGLIYRYGYETVKKTLINMNKQEEYVILL